VIEGQNGYLGSNLDELADRCLSAADLDREECRKFVEKNFDENSVYHNYMKVYDQLVLKAV